MGSEMCIRDRWNPVQVREDEQVLLDGERDVQVVELRRDAELRTRLLLLLGQAEPEHLELPRDHLVSKARHDACDPRQPVFPLVRDQDPKRAAQLLGLGLAERH